MYTTEDLLRDIMQNGSETPAAQRLTLGVGDRFKQPLFKRRRFSSPLLNAEESGTPELALSAPPMERDTPLAGAEGGGDDLLATLLRKGFGGQPDDDTASFYGGMNPLPGVTPPTKPKEPVFRRGDYTLEPVPEAPTYPDAPKRDLRREREQTLIGSAILALLGGVAGGGMGALAAGSGALRGGFQRADADAEIARREWEDETQGIFKRFTAARQGAIDKNNATLFRKKADDDYNESEADRYRTETGAYNQQLGIFQRAKASQETNDRLTRQGEEKAKTEAEEKTRKERADFFDFLADLDEPSQQQALQLAEQSGDLERLGIHLTQGQDGRYQFGLRKAPPQKAEESPEAIRRGQVEDDLRELYRVFNNPKLNAAGQKKIAERIARRQAELGISAEEGSLAGVLDEMTPYQRETLKQAQTRIDEQKRHNQKTEATAAQNAATAASRASGSGGPSATANRLERQGWLKGELSRIKNARGRLLGQLNTGKITLDFYLQKSARFDQEEDAVNKKAFAEPAPAGTTGTVNFAKPTPESVANERKVKLPNGGTAILRKIAPGQPSPVKK